MFLIIGCVTEGYALDHSGVSAFPDLPVIEGERGTRVGIGAQEPPDGSGVSGGDRLDEVPPDVTTGDRRRDEIAILECLDGESSECGDGVVGTGAVEDCDPRDVKRPGTDPPQGLSPPWPEIFGSRFGSESDCGRSRAIVPEDGSGWTRLDGGIASARDLPGALPRWCAEVSSD